VEQSEVDCCGVEQSEMNCCGVEQSEVDFCGVDPVIPMGLKRCTEPDIRSFR
jgi:hypothetical protein